jgi:hypothetical protein
MTLALLTCCVLSLFFFFFFFFFFQTILAFNFLSARSFFLCDCSLKPVRIPSSVTSGPPFFISREKDMPNAITALV